MSRKTLSDEDGRAVDLLLDRSNDGQGQGNFAAPLGPSFYERVGNVEKILQAVAAMPALDPAPDLVMRTMQRIAERTGEGSTVESEPRQIADPSRPLA